MESRGLLTRKSTEKTVLLTLCLTLSAGKERGWGLRCSRDLRAGEFVCEYAGEVITTEEAVSHPAYPFSPCRSAAVKDGHGHSGAIIQNGAVSHLHAQLIGTNEVSVFWLCMEVVRPARHTSLPKNPASSTALLLVSKGLPCADLRACDAQEAVDPELDHDKYLYDMRNFSGAATSSQDPEMQVG